MVVVVVVVVVVVRHHLSRDALQEAGQSWRSLVWSLAQNPRPALSLLPSGCRSTEKLEALLYSAWDPGSQVEMVSPHDGSLQDP